MLAPSELDFWMGLLLRCVSLVALALIVVEVRLPPLLTGASPQTAPVPVRASRRQRDDKEEDAELEVPLVPSAVLEKARPKKDPGVVEIAVMILIYMSAAIGIVYLNAYILLQWPWAATLTMLQMVFCSLAARVCVAAGVSDPTKVGMTKRLYATICVPLALLYTFYLYGSNAVYDYLPVGYIQLLKPGQAAGVYALLAIAGKEEVAPAPLLNLVVILGAVVVASVAKSEIAGWSTMGFILMMTSNGCYSMYLVGQQLVLNTSLGDSGKSAKLDPVTTLYFLGPATACGLAVVAACTEWGNGDFSITGMSWWVLLADCCIAFSLNLIQIKIIGKLSALTYMFAGYIKGFLTVAISVAFFGEDVDALEIAGYAVMLLGQVLWSLRKLRHRGPRISDGTSAAGPDPGLKVKVAAAGALLAAFAVAGLFDPCLLLPC